MQTPSHLEHGMNNLLNAEDPDSIWCRVTNMFSNDVFTGLSVALSNVGSFKADAFLRFNGIRYFDGPLFWQGANIRTASQAERDTFIGNTNLELRNLSGYFLYEIPTQVSVIHIIALNIFFEESGYELQEKRDEELFKRVIIRE